MSTEWAKQQEQLKAAGALCAVTEDRKKAIQEQHNAALEEIRQARNKTKPTPADIERLTFFHPMNRVHFPYGFASGPL